MKKILSLICIMLSTVIFLSACSSTATTTLDPSEHSESKTFDTIPDLIEYIQSNNSVKSSIQSAYPPGMERNRSDTIAIFMPATPPKGYELSEISLAGTNIYFRYNTHKYLEYLKATEQSQESSMSDNKKATTSPSSEPDEVANAAQNRIDDGETLSVDDQEIAYSQNTISIGWSFSGDGNRLIEFVNANSEVVKPLEQYPGVYYSDSTPLSDNIIYGKNIYWTKDNYVFQAYIPMKELSSMLSPTDGALSLVQAVNFSTKTFEALE